MLSLLYRRADFGAPYSMILKVTLYDHYFIIRTLTPTGLLPRHQLPHLTFNPNSLFSITQKNKEIKNTLQGVLFFFSTLKVDAILTD